MQINQSVYFVFSGCDYHPPPPPQIDFGLDVARAFLEETGSLSPTSYQLNLYRDLLLAFARELAKNLGEVEPAVRADVRQRRGHDEWSAESVAGRGAGVGAV